MYRITSTESWVPVIDGRFGVSHGDKEGKPRLTVTVVSDTKHSSEGDTDPPLTMTLNKGQARVLIATLKQHLNSLD